MVGRRRCALALAATASWLATGALAHAATFTVTVAGDPAPGACDASCSLREAVIAANTNAASPDLILLPPGTYALSLAGAGENAAASGDLDLTANGTTIRGTGASAAEVVVTATGLGDRIFDVVAADVGFASLTLTAGTGPGGAIQSTDGEVTVEGVAFQGNTSPGGGGAILNSGAAGARLVVRDSVFTGNVAVSGGAIQNESSARLVVLRSSFSDNHATGLGGGALFNQDAGHALLHRVRLTGNRATTNRGGAIFNQNETALVILDSTIDANRAAGDGGGIFNQNDSALTIVRSTIAGNVADGPGASEGGGGLYLQNDAAVSILESTISGNRTAGNGGGVFRRNDGQLVLRNTTLSGNTAALTGGGLAVGSSFGQASVLLDHTTVAGNAAATGGGLFVASFGANLLVDPVRLRGTIVAGNLTAGAAGDCTVEAGGLITSLGFNLSTTPTCQLTASGDQPGADPRLGPLADNGGPTATHALLAGSAAIDAGPSTCPDAATDQRGVARAQPAGGRCDAGAFETRAADLRVSVPDEPGPTPIGAQLAFRVIVVNGGPETAGAARLSLRLPAGASLVGATPSAGSCGPSAGGVVTCELGPLAAGAEARVTVSLTSTAAGELVLVATAASEVLDRATADNEATGRTTVVATSAPLSDADFAELVAALALGAPRGRGQGGSLVPRRACTIVGTSGNDTLTGTPGNDVICGLGGKDTIDGQGGRDLLDGGAGADALAGGTGADVLLGLAGNDALAGNAGPDRLYGGAGADTLTPGAGRDRADGGPGRDRALGPSAGDTRLGIERLG